MPKIEELKKIAKMQNEETIIATIPKILGITNSQVQTISFIFWFCYMVETSMNNLLQEAWKKTEDLLPPIKPLEERIIKELIGIDVNSLNQLSCFGDKIKVIAILKGKTDFVKMLWKLKNLRDDISHNRIGNLTYNDEDILKKETKEKMLTDFLEFSIKQGDEEDIDFGEIITEEKIKEMLTK